MNILEFHIGVNLRTQKIGSNVNDNFLPEEIDYFLNEAVKDYIKAQYSSIKNEDRNLESQFTNENLRPIIKTENLSNIGSSYLPNSIEGGLPNDYLYYIFARTTINGSLYNNRKLEPKGIKDYIETEFNSPIFRELPLLIEGNKVTVIGNVIDPPDTNSTISFTYIKKPDKISLQGNESTEYTSLPDHTHQEIVNIASDKILQIINPAQ